MTCAGRAPGPQELRAVKAAAAVILPQGCREDLYQMARANCSRVFPNYEARFAYPGKTGQIALFERSGVPCPRTAVFSNTREFFRQHQNPPDDLPFGFPCVFKFDWGGEGETVYPVGSPRDLAALLKTAAAFEKSGQSGFLLQERIPGGNRCLRIAVIGRRFITYWRIQSDDRRLWANLSKGGKLDYASDPELQADAVAAAEKFCRSTGINLAGIDVLFSGNPDKPHPFFLEINYFFGRKGLGGSEAYYEILVQEINNWLHGQGLSVTAAPPG